MNKKKVIEARRVWAIQWIEQLSVPKFLVLIVVCSAGTGVILSQLI
ncbi:hypothetical protein WH297_17655 [Ochrobactrum vermis]|uniref:Chloride channel protein n=1 Tax=Ochrobactrum vermis TaxID=1827297 RepID=A0ABU8PH17_9HYPH|nr:hypothetical protein [Ochrobactrum vermis]